jgi:putative SOS response-associated peptidase YedK
MCGRFSLSLKASDIQSVLLDVFSHDLVHDVSNFSPKYNVAPSQRVWSVIFDGAHYRVGTISWGLIPSLTKQKNNAFKMINAKTETIFDKPLFSKPIVKTRCLILADGFYEWKDNHGTKIPHHISLNHGSLFAFAGIYTKNIHIESKPVFSAAILTQASKGFMQTIHTRSPIMLEPKLWKQYLNPHMTPTQIQTFFIAQPDHQLQFKTVSNYVNKPGNEGSQCLDPYESTTLF